MVFMSAQEVREKFIRFFESRNHTAVPSSSLIPDDPSVLLTTAGMQQFKPYYSELDPDTAVHPSISKPVGKNAVSIQKSFRTSDIDEVGDESHLTFFEMMGNFSFGGYFKKEAITLAHEFLTKELGLTISYVTIFEGSNTVPKDEESRAIWRSLGIEDEDIREEGMEDVFWGPTGTSGPCGPTTEIYFKNAKGQDVETWNLVFNEYFYPGSREELLSGAPEKKLEKLKTAGVDTGMGLERLMMALQNKKNIFETDLFMSLSAELPAQLDERRKRIIADHVRGVTFLLGDGVVPSNKGAGYILRRLMRRMMTFEKLDAFAPEIFEKIITLVIGQYASFYPELLNNAENIRSAYAAEREKFRKNLDIGLRAYEAFLKSGATALSGAHAFNMYQTFGFPREVMRELCLQHNIGFDDTGFEEELKKHQELSRAGAEKKFGGHGLILDTGELKAANEEELKKVTRLHTATHMLQAALRHILGSEVHQMGSDITAERLRFDFTFARKVTSQEIARVEDLVNQKIKEDEPVIMVEMPIEAAKVAGALTVERAKYAPVVKVYSIENFSKEVCGGPHVSHTGEVGVFRIVKEEASAAGIRRMRATVE